MNTLSAICPMVMLTTVPLQAEPAGQHGDEEVRVHGVEQHLEDELKATSPAAVLRVALRQLVPDDHHGDAARQPDHDQADHVLRVAARKTIARTNIRIGPMTQFCTSDSASTCQFRKTRAHLLVLHLGERRIHHQDEADGDRDGGRADLKAASRHG